MLSQVCCKKMVTSFAGLKMKKWYATKISRIIEYFQKNVLSKDWRSWVSTMCVMTFATTKKPFRNQLFHFMITYPFYFQAYSSSMLESTFSALYIMTFHMSTFLSRTDFPHLQFIFFLLNKTIKLPFHDYIAFLSLP